MQLMLALSRLTGRQSSVPVPRRPSAEVILSRIAREFDRASTRPLIDGIDSRLAEAALTNDLRDPKKRPVAVTNLTRLAEADLSAGRCVHPFVERKLGEVGVQLPI